MDYTLRNILRKSTSELGGILLFATGLMEDPGFTPGERRTYTSAIDHMLKAEEQLKRVIEHAEQRGLTED